jgi:hypothetical protein
MMRVAQRTATIIAAGLLALLPLMYRPTLFAPSATPRAIMIGVAGPVLLAISVTARALRGQALVLRHPVVFAAAVALLLLHLVSAAWTPDRLGARLWNGTLFSLLCWLAFITVIVGQRSQAMTLIAAAAGGGVLAGLVGILQHFDRPIAFFSQTLVPGSTFVYANVAAQFFAPLVVILLVMAVRSGRALGFAAWAGALLVAGGYLELTRCRGAWLATVLACVLVGGVILAAGSLRGDLRQRLSRAKLVAAGLGVAAVVAALAFIPQGGAFHRRTGWAEMLRSFVEPVQVVTGGAGEVARSSSAMRWQMLGCARRALREHWLFGLGSDGFRAGIVPYLDQPTATLCYSPTTQMLTLHCDPVQLVLETGILGGTAALVLVLGVLAAGWRLMIHAVDGDTRWVALACLGGLATIGLHSLVDFPFHMPTSSFLAATLAGVVLGLDRGTAGDQPALEIRKRGPALAVAAILAVGATINGTLLAGHAGSMWHLNVAWAAKTAGVGDVALREIDAGLAASALSPTARREYGVIHARFDPDRPAALRAVQRALADDPHYINNLVNAAGVEMELGRYTDARAHLEQALSINAELHLAHYGLGQIAAAEGRPRDARTAFERCLVLRPDYEPARRQLDALPQQP